MTKVKKSFYNKIRCLEPEYKVIPQANLVPIISKENNNRYYIENKNKID